MQKKWARRQGFGQGAGEKVEILTEGQVSNILDNVDLEEVLEIAWQAQNRGRNGYCVLNLETGKLQGVSLNENETLQAIDSTHIIIFKVSANIELSKEDYLTQEEIQEGKPLTKNHVIENWVYNDVPLDWDIIRNELMLWYDEVEEY